MWRGGEINVKINTDYQAGLPVIPIARHLEATLSTALPAEGEQPGALGTEPDQTGLCLQPHQG